MPKKQVVIIGAGLGGLSAAIHCRLQGHDVLVLEQGAVGGKAAGIEIEGYRLDPGPSIIILPRIYRNVFEAAGRKMEDYLRFQRLDPISRVFFQSREPIDLPSGRQACEDLVDSISKTDGASFRKLLSTMDKVTGHIDKSIFKKPYLHPWQLADPHLIATALRFDVKKSYRELVDDMFSSELLRAFFYGFPSYGGQTYDSKAAGALMIPYLMVQEGVWYPEGGVRSIPEAFHRLAVELGVEFQMARVTGLVHQNGRIRAVKTEDGEVATDAVISNVDPLVTGEWLGRKVNFEPSLSYFTLHWGIRREISGPKHHTLLIPDDYQKGLVKLYHDNAFPNPPTVYLNATNLEDPSTAPAGCTNLFAVVTTPSIAEGLDWEQRIPEYRQAVLDVMESYGFGISGGEMAFERIQSPLYFQAKHNNYRGSLYGAHERHRHLGLFPPRNDDAEFKNLFYAGGGTQPGAGLPMVTLSGKFAAELLSKR